MAKTMDNKLIEILEQHKLWVDSDGTIGSIANLSDADLSEVDLRSADLRFADLTGADLRQANLNGANLRGACLNAANLNGANIRNTDLRQCNLSDADLSGADLSGSDLAEAYLVMADLSGSDLSEANLIHANLNNVLFNEFTSFFALQCPEKGPFTAYKKASGYIVELDIPPDSKRSSSTSRKCRCSKAFVKSITNLDGSPSGKLEVASNYDNRFIYRLDEMVQVTDFDDNRWNECSSGIHFFITREEAVNYG